jgi:hypothetical protein
VFTGTGIRSSQASQPLCIVLDVPGPQIQWMAPTPPEDDTLTTYMGCLFAINLTVQDASNYFDLDILAFQVRAHVLPACMHAASLPACMMTVDCC